VSRNLGKKRNTPIESTGTKTHTRFPVFEKEKEKTKKDGERSRNGKKPGLTKNIKKECFKKGWERRVGKNQPLK